MATGISNIKNVQPTLTKKSTALEVLKTLNQNKLLSPYVSQSGVAVVTGGSSGIGAVSVETLALAGMKVVLCARNTEAAQQEISTMSGADRIRVQELDLTDFRSIAAASREIIETEGSVDVLLNNAGVMAQKEREETSQGLEMQFGTNHVGHHYLTRSLLPVINRGGRIVTVASTAHTMGDIDVSNLNYTPGVSDRKYSPWGAYGQSKLANILFAKGLQDRLNESDRADVKSVSLHPGVISTPLWKHNNFLVRAASKLFSDKNVDQGAATNVFCCLVEPSAFEGGEYMVDCQTATPNTMGQDSTGIERTKLWDATEAIIAKAGFDLP
eukprot:CAMPEP_0194372742 /NCGR_PEP_ID=MMETSP0174-20130528/21128_1 /TAXON_ID=216777 /ORGANISM="Proboscia alata, Strain PI-D3" /LENGTH=326 /DNA_ID=CAMNT_0039151433 /DNA_START=285 /DNA_END=1261 /DNA_ORIENTATION=+